MVIGKVNSVSAQNSMAKLASIGSATGSYRSLSLSKGYFLSHFFDKILNTFPQLMIYWIFGDDSGSLVQGSWLETFVFHIF